MRPPAILKTANVSQIAFARDDRTLVGWAAGHVVACDMKTNQRKQPDLAAFEWRGAALSSDGRIIAGQGKKHDVKVLDLSGPRELLAFTLTSRGIPALALSGDGSHLALVDHVGGNRIQARVWDVQTGKELPAVKAGNRPARALCLSSNGALLAVGHENGNVVLTETTGGHEPGRFTLPGPVRALCFSDDGRWLAGASANGTLVLWNVAGRTESWRTQAPGRPFLSVAFSPNGQLLAAGTADGTVKLLHVEDGEERLSWRARPGGVKALVFSHDGLVVATATKRAVLCWQLPEP
jgi:WD40 repeat protein